MITSEQHAKVLELKKLAEMFQNIGAGLATEVESIHVRGPDQESLLDLLTQIGALGGQATVALDGYIRQIHPSK